MKVKEEKRCRVCRGKLKNVLDLGKIYPSSFLRDDEILEEKNKVPLVLAECKDCKLVQLRHTVNLDNMYRQYWYSSSLNKSMVSSLEEIVREIEGRISLSVTDVIIDIGCNDGTLLSLYNNKSIKVGFDPALNLKRDPDFVFINDYFEAKKYNFWKAKVITAIAMFYDLPDPHQFVEDVASILHEEGIFVIQFTDLLSMYKATAFDNICHEHLEYYKFADVKFLLEAHGLEVIDVSYNKVNGGSIRITAAHEGAYPKRESVDRTYKYEDEFIKLTGMENFKLNIEKAKEDIYNFLALCRTTKSKVFLLGASTKGNTFLQVCGITDKDVPYAAEVNPDKFGLRTGGSDIKIISEEDALSYKPDFLLVPVWHFKDNILSNSRIQEYIKEGGFLVFPLPEFTIAGRGEL